MKKFLISIVALPILAAATASAHRLSDAQLDAVTAGQFLGIECPGCTLSSSTSTSTNGVTMTTSSIEIIGGNVGNNGGNGGNGGGSNDNSGGGNGAGGGTGGPAGPAVTSVQPPSNLAAILKGAGTIVSITP